MKEETAETYKDAFLQHRDSFGVNIIINGVTVEGTVSESQFGRELMDGGFSDEADIDCKFLLLELSNQPELGNVVEYRNRKFKISNIGYQPGSLVGEITCRPMKRL